MYSQQQLIDFLIFSCKLNPDQFYICNEKRYAARSEIVVFIAKDNKLVKVNTDERYYNNLTLANLTTLFNNYLTEEFRIVATKLKKEVLTEETFEEVT